MSGAVCFGICFNNNWRRHFISFQGKKQRVTYVDLMVMQRSCSSLRVSVKRVSPALAPAMIPALETSESVKVDFPWSTWAMTDMLRMFRFLSIMPRISSTVKFTYAAQIQTHNYYVSTANSATGKVRSAIRTILNWIQVTSSCTQIEVRLL